jgi:hypothetical protein
MKLVTWVGGADPGLDMVRIDSKDKAWNFTAVERQSWTGFAGLERIDRIGFETRVIEAGRESPATRQTSPSGASQLAAWKAR